MNLDLDLSAFPFSLPGSYLTLTAQRNASRIRYSTCARAAITPKWFPQEAREFFDFALLEDGVEVSYTWLARPAMLELTTASGARARFSFVDKNTLQFDLAGVALRLIPRKIFHAHWCHDACHATVVDSMGQGFHQFTVWDGTIAISRDESVVWLNNAGRRVDLLARAGQFRFNRVEAFWRPEPYPFAELAQLRQQEYASWCTQMPRVEERYQPEAERAWFLLWANQVERRGGLTRDALYMSKFGMTGVWSWDNCFNSLVLAKGAPDLAWDQMKLFFDTQDSAGMLPEFVSDLNVIYSFTRPPLYGWVAMHMARATGLEKARPHFAELYEPMCRLARWWFEMRDSDGDGICDYHEGSDSGWDNCTIFDGTKTVEVPDVSVHMVLHLESLAEMAGLLGKPEAEVQAWNEAAKKQLNALLAHSVRDNAFVARVSGSHEVIESASLLSLMPLLLGRRLPAPVLENLVALIAPGGRYLTEFGLASEAIDSPLYEGDGYWRGPIWAPPTYFVFLGLLDAGRYALARDIARRYCELCLRNPGFWENYDAVSGKGLRCPGYAWTGAVFLLLAEWLASEGYEGR